MEGNTKAGLVAFLKTTEEPVFVLEVREGSHDWGQLSGTVATVRRPTAGDQGVFHAIETYSIEELESLEEKRKRSIAEVASLKAQFDSEDMSFGKAALKN